MLHKSYIIQTTTRHSTTHLQETDRCNADYPATNSDRRSLRLDKHLMWSTSCARQDVGNHPMTELYNQSIHRLSVTQQDFRGLLSASRSRLRTNGASVIRPHQ